MNPDQILKDAEDRMDKALDHLKSELRGIRTGRASTALVDFVKVDYYGSMTDLKALASISIHEATQILIKPFDVGAVQEIRKALEASDLGLNPQIDDKQIRINVPPLSTDRRKQLVGHAKKVAEDTKVALRNVRRDANKHADALKNDKAANISEDEVEQLKKEIQDVIKKHESTVETITADKSKEIMEV